MVKNSSTVFRPSSKAFSCLFDEFDRERILGFFLAFSLIGMVVGEFRLLGEEGGFEDDDSEKGLL